MRQRYITNVEIIAEFTYLYNITLGDNNTELIKDPDKEGSLYNYTK